MTEDSSRESMSPGDSDKLTALVKLALHQSGHVAATAYFAKSIVLFLIGFAAMTVAAGISFITTSTTSEAIGVVTLVVGGLGAAISWVYAWDAFSTGRRALPRDES